METSDILIVGGGMAGCILATRIAQNGINPKTGGRLKVGMMERGPYFGGDPKSGYGISLRRKMFTNITEEFRAGGRYSMGFFPPNRHGFEDFWRGGSEPMTISGKTLCSVGRKRVYFLNPGMPKS